jgi:outer membrane receptor protein involved in Fe transport
MEHENRNFDQEIANIDKVVKRYDFFPSIHLSKQLPWNLQLQASYSKRVNRPRDWNLDPLRIYQSPQIIRQGNAGLLPELANSYELNLQEKINEASFISIEGYYRETNNLIQQDTKLQHDTTIISWTNIDHDRATGAEFMINLALAKWFNFNASSSVYNYRLFGDTITVNSVPKSTNTWNTRINPTFRLTTGTTFQLNYTYNAPSIGAQGPRSGNYSSSVGIRQDILKHKGSLTLQMRDLFGHENYGSTSEARGLRTYSLFQRENKVFMLTFSYRINNYKAQQAKRNQEDTNGNNAPEELNGPGM